MIKKNQFVIQYPTLFVGVCLSLLLSASLPADAENTFLDNTAPSSQLNSSSSSGSSSISSSLTSSPLPGSGQFLPVEQAYQLTPSTDGHELVIDWYIAPGYYLYKHRFAIMPTEAKQATQPLALVFQSGEFIYDDYYEKDLEVFYTATQVRATLPAIPVGVDFADDGSAFILAVTTQGCADAGLCYPPRIEYIEVNPGDGIAELVDPVSTDSSAINNANGIKTQPLKKTLGQSSNLVIILVFAVLGGIILNLMPCVFPVLSIKVMATTSAHLGDHNKHVHSLAYSAGIILSFMAIAAVMLVLRGSGQSIGWGFQLQSPIFVALLAYLLFVIAQSFSGQLTIGGSWMNLGQNFTQSNSVSGSFMTGVLATVVASPCTAPFMGTALGVALTQSAGVSMAIFAALGLGMALPFLALSWIPGLMEKLPAPGPWMNTFSQLLAFPLYASVIWLLWVLGRQTSIDHAIVVSLGILLLAFAIWLNGHSKNIVSRGVLALSLLAALSLAVNQEATDQEPLWEPYSPLALSVLQDENRAVFINLTADWCITCLANEKIALSSEAFRSVLKTHDITYLKGDWTNNNPDITRLLNEHGRSGVPLYLYYDAKGNPAKILPQLLSEKVVLTAFGVSG
ncbi:MAG: protein-disulfide reductase DsbD [Porticoccaceae bacterium]|nr:protein-disulfide reductase DsbD [Porticoccaceae bacterium]